MKTKGKKQNKIQRWPRYYSFLHKDIKMTVIDIFLKDEKIEI